MLSMLTWKAQFVHKTQNSNDTSRRLNFSTKNSLPWKQQKAYYKLTTSLLTPFNVRWENKAQSDENPAEPSRGRTQISSAGQEFDFSIVSGASYVSHVEHSVNLSGQSFSAVTFTI